LLSEQNNLQREEISKLKEKFKKLEARLAKNSKNSHKPPSSDQNKPKKTESLRKKSGKFPGGKFGHKGSNLKKVIHPDKTFTHTVDNCIICGTNLTKVPATLDTRQILEIPKPKIVVTEHVIEIKNCKMCGHVNKAEYPTGVNQPTQYGPRAKGLMVYFNKEQLLPYHRIKLLFKSIFNQTISAGTVVNAVTESATRLENIESHINGLLQKSEILNCDETGSNISGEKFWLHVSSNEKLTHYGIHKKRGSEAMDDIGILPNYTGVMVHDHWRSYFKYQKASHALCNVHILRELKFIYEYEGLKWASKMSKLLYDMKDYKDKILSEFYGPLPPMAIQNFEHHYAKVLNYGRREQSIRGTKNSKEA